MKLLVCTADPQRNINVTRDLEEILRAINALDWKVVYLHDVTHSMLKAGVRQHKPDVVHFAGHSSPHEIQLVNQGNQAALISPKKFGQALRSGKPLKAVILSSCSSIAVFEALTDTAEWGIGTTQAVTDGECHKFTKSFYEHLSENKDVPGAFYSALRNLKEQGNFYILKMNGGKYIPWYPVTMALIAILLVALAVMTFLNNQRLSQLEHSAPPRGLVPSIGNVGQYIIQRLSQLEQRLSQLENSAPPTTGNLGHYIEKLQGREYTADNDGFVVALAEGMFVKPGDPDKSGEFSVLLKTGNESLDYRFSVVGSGNRPTNLFGSVIVPVPRGSKWIAKGTAGFQGVDFKSFKVYWISQVDAALK